MKLVVFDFCETLVDFQSADLFVDFIIQKEQYTKYRWVNIVRKVLTRIRFLAILRMAFPELNPSKRLKLLQIRGIELTNVKKYAEEFYDQRLVPNLIPPIYKLLEKHIANNDYVMIVSGGYAPYIKVFSEKHKIGAYFATEMRDDGKKLVGSFEGKDCLYQQKVVLLEAFLREHAIQYDAKVAYSDSISDMPLLKWADEAFVISKNNSQSWAKSNGFKEIIHY